MKAGRHFVAYCFRILVIALTNVLAWTSLGCASNAVHVVPADLTAFQRMIDADVTANARRSAHLMAQQIRGVSSGKAGVLEDEKLPEAYVTNAERSTSAARYHLAYAGLRLIREYYAAAHPAYRGLENDELMEVVDAAGGNLGMVHDFERTRHLDIASVEDRILFEVVPPGQEHRAAGNNKVDWQLTLLNNAMVGVPTFHRGRGYAGEIGVRFAEGAPPWKLTWETTDPGVVQYRWQALSAGEETEDAYHEAYVENRWHDPTQHEIVRFGRALHEVVERLVQAREALGKTGAAAKMPILPGQTWVDYWQSAALWSANDSIARLLPVVRLDPRLFAQTFLGGGAGGGPPLKTTELRRIYGNPNGKTGIGYNQDVGVMFQRLVLAHMPGPKLHYANTKPFASPVREKRTNLQYKSVIPDGVAGASIGSQSPLGATISTYPESSFIEVKAVKGKITLKYGQHQIEGMLDALSRSQAARSTGSDRAFPNMYFVITGDTRIAPDVIQEATRLNILVWLSFVTVDPSNNIQVAPPTCLNCTQVLLGGAQFQGFVLPGLPFQLKSQPAPRVPVLFDPPILDDGLVGALGIPGSTTPNP